VVRKPAGIVSVPDDHWRRGTLAQQVQARLPRRGRRSGPLGVVQRLDRDTSGLLVFARTREARLALKELLQRRALSRHYLGLVAGKAVRATYRSHLTEHPNGKRGSTEKKHVGQFACTHVEVVERLAGATLIRCELETGRTHQIRIHLSEAGHPVLGDRRYARRGIPCPPAPRVMLHAASLSFEHPSTGQPLRFEEPMPADMVAVIDELRR
jgi:23S rRNA pseudouridine1911/1915/1917 synthase